MKAPEIFRLAMLQLMEKTETKQSVLADSLNIKRPHMNAYIKGSRGFSEDKREEIANYFGKTYLEVLDLGRGITTVPPIPITVHTRNSHERDLLKQTRTDYIAVPLYTSGRVAAWSNGTAFDQYETPTSEVLVYTPELGHRAKHHLVAARVGGDSMEPLVPKDSIIIVDMDDKEFVDNKVFAVAMDEGGVKTLAVKRVRKFQKAEGFVLLSENYHYQPVLVVESDWLRLCVGRVIWMWRSFEG